MATACVSGLVSARTCRASTFGFDRQFEVRAIAVERPRPFFSGKVNAGLVGPAEKTILDDSVGRFIDDLQRVRRDRHNRNNRGDG